MNTTEQSTIRYKNPPIDEIVCSVLFDSIEGLRAGHLGFLWQKFRNEFPVIDDQNLIGPVSEEDLNNRGTPPLPRVWFVHEYENELIQVQFNRFIHNWRKRRPNDEYPGYKTVIGNFERYLSCFQDFLTEERLGGITLNRYELNVYRPHFGK